MKIYFLLLCALPLQLFGQTTIIKDVNVLDVENKKMIRDISVAITDGKVSSIDKFSKIQVSSADSVIDGKGKYLMPGMIDSHIHFFQSGGLYTRPDVIDLRDVVPYENEIQFAKDNASDYFKRYLSNGITTVIDVGGPLWNFKVRDSITQNTMAPNVLVTGPLFSMVDRPQMDKGDPPIIKVTTKEEVLDLFNKQLTYRPDFIKVWYIVNEESPAEKTFPLIEYLGQLCKQNDLKLAVHATQLGTAKLAVQAGASILVHSIDDSVISKSFIKELKEKNVTYIPTLTVMDGYFKTFTGKIDHQMQDLKWANPSAYNSILDPNKMDTSQMPPRLRSMYGGNRPPFLTTLDSIMRVNLSNLSKAGVNISTGTDAGNIGTMHASSYLTELLAMKKADLSNWEVIAYSTINPAKGFGIGDKIGSIKVGKQADLLLLNKNPLEDIRNVNAISLVIKSGELLNQDSILIESPEQIVQRQVNAYNARDIEAFLDTYATNVKIYNEQGQLTMEGHDAIRAGYTKMFESVTNLYCEIENRIVINNKVIDKEKVRFNKRFLNAVAIYEVSNGKITKVSFVK